MLSLLASTLQEFIASLVGLRAVGLRRGLRKMLVEAGTKRKDAKAAEERTIWNHPLIAPSFVKRKLRASGPSYLPPRLFALSILDTLAPPLDPSGKPVAGSRDVLGNLETAIGNLPAGLKEPVGRIVVNASGDVAKIREGLELWFDDTMARVSGWYKRWTQVIIVVIAAVVTVAMNANTVTMGERLWKDPAVRGAVVGAATSPDVTGTLKGSNAKEKLKDARAAVDEVPKLGVPLGWKQADKTDPRHVDFNWRTIGGWLLTILAISLGAPFWFDTLSRLSRLRGTGKPEAPLPASGYGKPGERVTPAPQTTPPTVNVTVERGRLFGG
jgi:hypothetical protein